MKFSISLFFQSFTFSINLWHRKFVTADVTVVLANNQYGIQGPGQDLVQLLQQETPEFIAPDLWPPNSPALNPVDYRVWCLMQERVYKTAVCDTADLKQRLDETWSSIPQAVIDEAIDEWGLLRL